MQIILNNSSMKPIYEQLVDNIKDKIISEELLPDTKLPSVRILAKDLKISALTVKKAYDSLEENGYIITVHGKGSYVASGRHELAIESQRKQVEDHMAQVVLEGRRCQLTDEEMIELLKIILEEG